MMYGQQPPFNPNNFLFNNNYHQFQPPNNFPLIFPSNPNFPFPNPNFLPQNFAIPNPNFNNNNDEESSRGRLLNETIQKIDKAVARARREIVAAGEHVSAVKVLEAAIVILEVDSWESLGGIQMQHVPSLYRLMRLQGKVNSFINCFVEVWKITTLYDLETEICKNEGVTQFEELELGPLIRHPLIIRYFSVSSYSTGVFRISGEEVVKLLVKFTNTRKGKKKVKVDAFLEFIAKKRSVDSKEKLHVRIQSLRLHSALISKASPLEIAKLKKYLLGVGYKPKKVLRFLSKCQSKHSSPNMKSSDRVTCCLHPYPSATDEKKQLGILSGKGDGTCIEGVIKSIRKRKLDAIDCKSFSSRKVPKRDDVGQASVGNNISSKFNLKHKHEVDMSLDPDSLMTFITSWKDACKKAKDSKVVAREAIYYGLVDSSFKTSLVSWALPYAQRYIYNIHPNAYFELRRSGFNDLRIVEVEKLFYRDVIKKKKLGIEYDKPCECSCLLQDNILYATRESDTHPLFMELSRFLLAGVPDLHLANFLHMITTMAESGSTEEQKEFFMTSSQKLLNLPVEESPWSLASLPSLEENTDIPTTSSGFTLDDLISPKSPAKKLGNTKTKPFNTAKTRRDVREGLIENDGNWIVQENSTSTIASVSLEEEALDDGVESGIGSMDVGFKGQLDYGKIIVSSNSVERDQLSRGTDIPPHVITGRTGEFVAFKYFSAKFGEKRVIWVNEVKESGLPYDIVVEGKDNSNEYIEVKATSDARKVWFGISVRQWQFAVEKGDSFSIARVVISDGKSAQITTHRNPAKLCQSRDLQLAIVSLKR